MEKRNSTYYSNPRLASFKKRLSSCTVNFIISLLFSFVIGFFIVNNTYKPALGYKDKQETYERLNKEYSALQDSYGIYCYDSSSQRIINNSLEEASGEAFNNDPRVIELKEIIPQKENELLIIEISSIAISYLLGGLVSSFVGCFIFGIGNNIGTFLNHFFYMNEDHTRIKFKRMVGYYLTRYLFLYVLGLITCFIVPVVFLYHIYYDEKNRSWLEKRFKVIAVVIEKYATD